jgi:hypothetical protein
MDQKQRRASCLPHAVPRSSRYSEKERSCNPKAGVEMSTPTTLLDDSDRRTLRRLTLALCLIVSGTVFATLASGVFTWESLLKGGPIAKSAVHFSHKHNAGSLRSASGSTSGPRTNSSGPSGGNAPRSAPKPSSKPPVKPSPKSQPGLYPPASIAADCSTDVTAELQAFFDSVPDGSLVRLKSHGCYLVSVLQVGGHKDLTVDGNGATLKASMLQTKTITRWYDETNLTVRNLTIVGADPTPGVYKPLYHANAGILFSHVINGKILNVEIRNVAGDFVYVGPSHPRAGPDFYPSQNVSIIGLHGSYAGRDGISFAYCEKGLLANSRLTMTGRSAVDLVDINKVWRADDITIEDNQFTHPGTGFLVMGGHGNNLVVRDNVVSRHGLWTKDHGVSGDPNHGFVFANNRSDAASKSPFVILLHNVTDVVISGNSQLFPPPPNGGRTWVLMCDTSNVRVVNNHVTHSIPIRLKPGCVNTDWLQNNNG